MCYSILQSQNRFIKNQSQIYDVPQLCTESSSDNPANRSKLVVYADLHHSTNPPAAPLPTELKPVVYTEISGIQATIGNSICAHQVSHLLLFLHAYGLLLVSHVLTQLIHDSHVSMIVMSVIIKGNTPTDRRIHVNVTALCLCNEYRYSFY